MRVLRRFQRQLKSLQPSRLVDAAVRLRVAVDHWLDDGQLLPAAAERAAMYGFAAYLLAAIAIWAAVCYHNHVDIFGVNQ